MRGKRAKILREWANYDMKKEREEGRRYRIMEHNIRHMYRFEVIGARAIYKMLKRRSYANRWRKSHPAPHVQRNRTR